MSENPKKKGLIVLGAGLPRTGTASLSEALGIIYGSPCYHMRTVFKDWSGKEGEFWAKAVTRRLTPEVQNVFIEHINKICLKSIIEGVTWELNLLFKDASK